MIFWSQKLLICSGVFFVMIVIIASLGERTLPLFYGDRDLASRSMKTIFTIIGGLSFACAQPALWKGLANILQKLISHGGSKNALAMWVQRPELGEFALILGYSFLAFIALASFGLAVLLWTGQG